MIEYSHKVFPPQVENEAQQTLKQFLTSSKSQLSESEEMSLAQATCFSISFGSIDKYY